MGGFFEGLSNRTRRNFGPIAAFVMALCIWAPCLHLLFKKDVARYRSDRGLSPAARKLAATHLATWSDPQLRKSELDRMRMRNPEWDFMSRTYFVLALANMALRDESYSGDACEIIDAIIDNTLEIERGSGFEHFLLEYGRRGGWVVRPPRSLFVDGEIALMLATRRFVEEKESYRPLLAERVEAIVSRMEKGPVLCAESYPDECWLFCNTVALAAVRMADALDGSDHAEFLASWVRTAKEKLLDRETGLLISSFAVDGTPAPSGFGPEGTTIWMAGHMLQVVDPEFAEDQYRRAKKELARSFLGFGYSREWPSGQVGSMDVDSGPVIPVLGASASASGLAIMAAAAFDDAKYFGRLMSSLEFAGFPSEHGGKLRYNAGNPVGDAVLLYAMTEGALWDEVNARMKK